MPKYHGVTADGWRWRVADEWRAAFESGAFSRFEDLLRAGRPIKDLKIKRTVEVRVDGREFLVKIYKRRGALQSLRAALFGSRAARELQALLGVLDRGISTLPFVAVGDRKAESCVIIEKASDRVRLDILLATSRRRRKLIEEYGRWARRVHDAGVAQYDFNPTNVLARRADDPDLRLIDFEKVTVGRPPSEADRLRSLAKIDRMIPASRADRLRFLKAYFGGDSSARLRDRAERVVRLAREQRALDARRRRDGCVRENRHYARFKFGRVWGWYRRDAMGEAAIADVAEGRGAWRRVEVARAIEAWRAANGSMVEAPPAAVVVSPGSSRGHLVYGPVAP